VRLAQCRHFRFRGVDFVAVCLQRHAEQTPNLRLVVNHSTTVEVFLEIWFTTIFLRWQFSLRNSDGKDSATSGRFAALICPHELQQNFTMASPNHCASRSIWRAEKFVEDARQQFRRQSRPLSARSEPASHFMLDLQQNWRACWRMDSDV